MVSIQISEKVYLASLQEWKNSFAWTYFVNKRGQTAYTFGPL